MATNYFERRDLFKVKRNMEEAGIEMNTFKSAIPFSEFKTDDKVSSLYCAGLPYRSGADACLYERKCHIRLPVRPER